MCVSHRHPRAAAVYALSRHFDLSTQPQGWSFFDASFARTTATTCITTVQSYSLLYTAHRRSAPLRLAASFRLAQRMDHRTAPHRTAPQHRRPFLLCRSLAASGLTTPPPLASRYYLPANIIVYCRMEASVQEPQPRPSLHIAPTLLPPTRDHVATTVLSFTVVAWWYLSMHPKGPCRSPRNSECTRQVL